MSFNVRKTNMEFKGKFLSLFKISFQIDIAS